MSGGVAGGTVKVEVHLGGIPYGQFPIDLSTELPFVAKVERYRARPVVELPDVDQLPEFRLYPLPDQVADKVCAMYERHGSDAVPSSRYRDLVDLVLITANFELDAGLTAAALTAEARRRGLAPPTRLHAPGAGWESGYRAEARRSSLAPELRELATALLAAGPASSRCWPARSRPGCGTPPIVDGVPSRDAQLTPRWGEFRER